MSKSLQHLSRVCVCVGMFLTLQQTIYNCSLIFTSSHAEPSTSARGERLNPFWVFFGHTHSPSFACGHRNFQEQISLSQRLRTSKISVFIFKIFWLVSHQPQPAMLLPVVPMFNNCDWLFSANVLGSVLFSRGISELAQMKASPENGAGQQATRDVNSDNFEGIGTLRPSQPYGFASSKACEATDFHNYCSFSFSSLPQRKGEVMGLGHTECCETHRSY